MNGLVLEGGGARGSYQVGAIKALNKKKIKIDYVVGASIGSINGAFYAAKQYRKLESLWKSFTSKEIFGIDQQLVDAIENKKIDKGIIKTGLQTVYQIIKSSGIDTKPLRATLSKYLNEEKFKKSNIDFGLITYNLSKAKSIKIFKKDIPKGKLTEYLIASSYLPIFKFEKIIDNSFYIDGGALDRCPVEMILDKKLDTIYVIRLYQNKLSKYNTNSKIIEVMPSKTLGSLLAFDKQTTQNKILLGFYDTLKVLDNLDGNRYYLKFKNEEYYNKLFSLIDGKQIYKKYNKNLLITNNKKIIINIIEDICDKFKINRYKIYDIRYLIIKLKILNFLKKDDFYSKFIKEIKVR